MGITAAIVGAIGGLCAVMGIITAAEVMPPVLPQLTWDFWLALSAVLLLGAIAFALGRGYE
ncbi:MAG TPA: hypothetical protein G4O01_00825 [Dehalococcoidia bacterium]|jgi:hypothetical protein|nr:hypothetical protein [Dehalococcoidia bacterium]